MLLFALKNAGVLYHTTTRKANIHAGFSLFCRAELRRIFGVWIATQWRIIGRVTYMDTAGGGGYGTQKKTGHPACLGSPVYRRSIF